MHMASKNTFVCAIDSRVSLNKVRFHSLVYRTFKSTVLKSLQELAQIFRIQLVVLSTNETFYRKAHARLCFRYTHKDWVGRNSADIVPCPYRSLNFTLRQQCKRRGRQRIFLALVTLVHNGIYHAYGPLNNVWKKLRSLRSRTSGLFVFGRTGPC